MSNDALPTGMPCGLRDTQDWYLGVDPLKVVDHSLVDYVFEHGGQELLDLGCGLGGYSKVLEGRGRKLVAFDVNERYVDTARQLGVDAHLYDGQHIPLPDKSVDSVFMIEVLEHIEQPERLIAELRRVARRNLIVTVPNCTQKLAAPVVFDHMLDVDHKTFFTAESLRALLELEFTNIQISQVLPIDAMLASALLPPWMLRLWRAAHGRRIIRDRYYYRLVATASV